MTLELKNVDKVYDKKVLNNVNCILKNGVYGLLGPNGAGKSTLIRLICYLEAPTSGNVLLDGKPIKELDGRYRSILGYVPQKVGYYPDFTARDFLNYMCIVKGISKKESKETIENVLSQVNLDDTGLTRIKNFSGGMKQRLSIAQAILNNPDILILDEPTSGLDLEERMRFKQFISEYANDKIVVFATHIVSDIEDIGNELIILSNGKVKTQSSPEELLSAVEGKVWDLTCEKEEADILKKKYPTSNIKTKGNVVELRLVTDKQPTANSVLAKANLQDLYLFLLENNEFEI
ncbi:MAG: ABC transporter ATP-binding protein [Lachnospiraceae bacterium]|nr:ABC transporter ATP-binding protein [Lachnospiraceae bacterium]